MGKEKEEKGEGEIEYKGEDEGRKRGGRREKRGREKGERGWEKVEGERREGEGEGRKTPPVHTPIV